MELWGSATPQFSFFYLRGQVSSTSSALRAGTHWGAQVLAEAVTALALSGHNYLIDSGVETESVSEGPSALSNSLYAPILLVY